MVLGTRPSFFPCCRSSTQLNAAIQRKRLYFEDFLKLFELACKCHLIQEKGDLDQVHTHWGVQDMTSNGLEMPVRFLP